MYTSLDDAKIEIRNRWNNANLKAAVEQYLSWIPAPFSVEPRAVLCRHIISATTELIHFLQLAKEINLKHLGAEYLRDRFCTQNPDKMLLVKMGLIVGSDKNGAMIYVNKKITAINENDNRRFVDIETFGGESLADFHHRLIKEYGIEEIEILDMSDWYESNGAVASEYYKNFMALFICHGVLFETFVTNESESEFARDVVLPAIDDVHQRFGVAPLIVQNLPTPEDQYWLCYPAEVFK